MSEPTYAESIASRGKSKPKERAELSDRMFAAFTELTQAAEGLREAACSRLDASPGAVILPFGVAQTSFDDALEDFDEARRAAFRFLLAENDVTVMD